MHLDYAVRTLLRDTDRLLTRGRVIESPRPGAFPGKPEVVRDGDRGRVRGRGRTFHKQALFVSKSERSRSERSRGSGTLMKLAMYTFLVKIS